MHSAQFQGQVGQLLAGYQGQAVCPGTQPPLQGTLKLCSRPAHPQEERHRTG